MKTDPQLRVRRSILELQTWYEQGNKKPLEDLMRAWKNMKALDPEDPRSFFKLGGFHGEPFRGAGWGNSAYWGGYCNHGNVLFPTWHRVYLLKLEDALRSFPGCEDVTMPYWDECDDYSWRHGIPGALTWETFVLDGQEIPNPLRSFVFPRGVTDNIQGGDPYNYSKPAGYETVRYPLSGLVGTVTDKEKTEAHNAQFPDYNKNVEILNQNIVHWLTEEQDINNRDRGHVWRQYVECLQAPNYTVFSNTTSAQQWNEDHSRSVVPLESPHNSIHLAVGGFDLSTYQASPIPGANGDMGENDTAGFDPIFFFHHCFVDYAFWTWQNIYNATNELEIIPGYPGTNSVDSQGPTPGVAPNSWLDLSSPLDPFKHDDGRPWTSKDCVHIEQQCGYSYAPGSLLGLAAPHRLAAAAERAPNASRKVVAVRGVNRAAIRGSFLISVYANINGRRVHVGSEAVLSRWSVKYCANCQTHLEAKAFVPLHRFDAAQVPDDAIEVELVTRDVPVKQNLPIPAAAVGLVAQHRATGKMPFRVEIR